ncbi:hypothetical protein EIP86_002748 [Pleurotus ostreatoroseus]|nr:hypothetical protein EIP86_002748 [Pleurotus ostreatoroseus]
MSANVDTVRSMENVVLDTTDVQDLASVEEPGSAEDGLVPSEDAQRGREDGTEDISEASSHEQDVNVAHTDANQTSHVPEPTSQTENTSPLDESTVQEKVPSPPVRSRSPSPVRVRRPQVSLSVLLERSDELFALYPPSHPAIALSSIMGPQSVVFTWSENPSELPSDDEAELMVTQPQLVVLPPPPPVASENKEGADDEHEREKRHRRHRRRLYKPRRLGAMVVERKTVVASAVLVLGVAMAIYGLQTTPERHHGSASRELRRMSRMFGGVLVGAGERIWDGIVGMTG